MTSGCLFAKSNDAIKVKTEHLLRLAALCAFLVLYPQASGYTKDGSPLSETDVTTLLQAGYESGELVELIDKRGFNGAVDADMIKRIRSQGASAGVILALKRQASSQTDKELSSEDPVESAINNGAAYRRPSASESTPRFAETEAVWDNMDVCSEAWSRLRRKYS